MDEPRLIPPYMHHADEESARVMGERAQAAADTDAGLARLRLASAVQDVDQAQARLEEAQVRLEEARELVDTQDTAMLATVIRRWHHTRPT